MNPDYIEMFGESEPDLTKQPLRQVRDPQWEQDLITGYVPKTHSVDAFIARQEAVEFNRVFSDVIGTEVKASAKAATPVPDAIKFNEDRWNDILKAVVGESQTCPCKCSECVNQKCGGCTATQRCANWAQASTKTSRNPNVKVTKTATGEIWELVSGRAPEREQIKSVQSAFQQMEDRLAAFTKSGKLSDDAVWRLNQAYQETVKGIGKDDATTA